MTPPLRGAGGPPRRARILVVDDEAAMLRTVERILERDHRVWGSTSPREALELARRIEPDLAIVDIRMEEMDGFEVMNALKRLDERLRVILMTGSAFETDEQLIRAIREKAFYYINKPFDREVLRTLVDRCLELGALEEANRRHLEHLESQLAEARAFQETMLPPRHAELEGFEIHAVYRPCEELAGDLYDYAAAGSGRVALVIADVVGHGASAAMLTALVKSAFHASHPEGFDPLAVVRRASEAIASFEAGLFVTMLCARISAPEGRLEYVNAGHDGGLVTVPEGHTRDPVIPLVSTGPLVSPVLRHLDWERRTVPWSPDSLILLYSDGIPESGTDDPRSGGQLFGSERIRRAAAGGAEAPGGAELLERILGTVDEFVGGEAAADDMTLLTARSLRRDGPRRDL